MKKLIAFLTILLLVLAGCSSDADTPESSNGGTNATSISAMDYFSKFEICGTIHNEVLAYTAANIEFAALAEKDRADAISHITAIQIEAVNNLNLDQSVKTRLIENFAYFSMYYDPNKVKESLGMTSNGDIPADSKIRTDLRSALEAEIIDGFEYEIFSGFAIV